MLQGWLKGTMTAVEGLERDTQLLTHLNQLEDLLQPSRRARGVQEACKRQTPERTRGPA